VGAHHRTQISRFGTVRRHCCEMLCGSVIVVLAGVPSRLVRCERRRYRAHWACDCLRCGACPGGWPVLDVTGPELRCPGPAGGVRLTR